jgi:hypothetical protein
MMKTFSMLKLTALMLISANLGYGAPPPQGPRNRPSEDGYNDGNYSVLDRDKPRDAKGNIVANAAPKVEPSATAQRLPGGTVNHYDLNDPADYQPPAGKAPAVLTKASVQQGDSSPIVDAPVPPDFELPAEIRGNVGAFISIKPKTKGKYIVYYPLDAGLQVFPSEMLSNKTQTVVAAQQAGRYRLLAYTAVGSIPSLPVVATVIVGDAPPGPGPGPGPGPQPPPTPTDPFVAALQTAYTADLGADRAVSLAFLKAAYVGMAASPPAGLTTNNDLFAWMKRVVQDPSSGLKATQLVGVRNVIAADLTKTFSASPTNPIDLDKVKTELSKVANALKEIK